MSGWIAAALAVMAGAGWSLALYWRGQSRERAASLTNATAEAARWRRAADEIQAALTAEVEGLQNDARKVPLLADLARDRLARLLAWRTRPDPRPPAPDAPPPSDG